MNKLIKSILISTALLTARVAALEREPELTLLSNKFIQIESFGSSVLALGQNGFTIFEWDSTNQMLNQVEHHVLPSSARSMKFGAGAGFIIRHENDDLSFLDLYDLKNIELAGQVAPPVDYCDFEVISDELYLSRWFDGIELYRIANFNELEFIKNDVSGVLMTQLQKSGNYLFALDMYNGVNRYDLNFELGAAVTKLLVNERPFAIGVFGDVVFISKNETGAAIGAFYQDSAKLIGEIADMPSPKRILVQGSPFVFLSEREVHLRESLSWRDLGSFQIDSVNNYGTIQENETQRHLLLPKLGNGISRINLADSNEKREALFRPGPVNSVLIVQNHLFTGGGGNPLEAYKIESESLLSPQLLRGEMTGLTDLAQSGNLLYALYAHEKKVVVFDMSESNLAPEINDSISISFENAIQIQAQDSLLLIISRNQIEVHSELFGETLWHFDKPIVEAEIQNNILYVTNRFGSIGAYTIHEDLSLTKCAERNLTGTGWAMESFDNHLFVFTGSTLTSFSGCLEMDTIVRLSLSALDAEIFRDILYTIGQDGIAKYDISSGLHSFIASGGLGGSQFSVNAGVIATTDGGSVHLYFENSQSDTSVINFEESAGVILFDNFPEPFNSSTTIQFELSKNTKAELAVYNLLGQKVKELANEYFSSGRHSVSWDGLDQNGLEMASGVYFYRLITGDVVISRKILLLK